MSAISAAVRARADEAVLVALTGALLVAGLTLGAGSAIAYLVGALPMVIAVVWWRPLYGFVALLGLVLVTEEFEIGTLATGIRPLLLEMLPIFRNLKDYTPLSPVVANAVELWLLLVVAAWLVKRALAWRLHVASPPCAGAWCLAVATIGLAFVLGIVAGGDVKVALWEVRALGYMLGLAWLVPQLVQGPRDVRLVLWVMTSALGLKALEGLYRYFGVLRMELDLGGTFVAHEDPVMFVPVIVLASLVARERMDDRLRRALLVTAPVLLLTLALTQRRSAYVSMAISVLFLVLMVSTSVRRKLVRLAAPCLLAGGVYVLLAAGSSAPWARPVDRALSLLDTANTSNLYRVVERRNLEYTIQSHPLGIGFGHPYEMLYALPRLDFPLYEYIPHNEVLWIWVKTGTLGFIAVMFFFARVVAEATWLARHAGDPLLRALACVVGLAVVNQLVASSYDLQLTYARSMIYLGTLVGLLGPVRGWIVASRPRRAGGADVNLQERRYHITA
jgi:hypothetical protein